MLLDITRPTAIEVRVVQQRATLALLYPPVKRKGITNDSLKLYTQQKVITSTKQQSRFM